MRDGPFDSTPEFKHFKEVMRGVISVSKKRLDELVQKAKEESPRKNDPDAPGRKCATKRKKRGGIKPPP